MLGSGSGTNCLHSKLLYAVYLYCSDRQTDASAVLFSFLSRLQSVWRVSFGTLTARDRFICTRSCGARPSRHQLHDRNSVLIAIVDAGSCFASSRFWLLGLTGLLIDISRFSFAGLGSSVLVVVKVIWIFADIWFRIWTWPLFGIFAFLVSSMLDGATQLYRNAAYQGQNNVHERIRLSQALAFTFFTLFRRSFHYFLFTLMYRFLGGWRGANFELGVLIEFVFWFRLWHRNHKCGSLSHRRLVIQIYWARLKHIWCFCNHLFRYQGLGDLWDLEDLGDSVTFFLFRL